MKTVVATGVFEVLHPGHILYLNEASKLGDQLIVVVACDETARRRKRHPIVPENQRAEVVASLKPVDGVIIGDSEDIFKTIVDVNPDVLALGFDQEFDEKELSEAFRALGLKTKVVRVRAHWKGPLNKTRKIIESFRRK
jgi:FAD synthetase